MPRVKVAVSMAFASTAESQDIRQRSVSQQLVRPKERDKAKKVQVKVEMTERVRQLAKDGEMEKFGLFWAKVGVSTGQQE